MESTQIVIIGGGFSGLSVALHWLRFHGPNVTVTLIESTKDLDESLVGQTEVCENLGLFYDDSMGFMYWLHERGFTQYKNEDQIPEQLYAEYLTDYKKYFLNRFPNFKVICDQVLAINFENSISILQTQNHGFIAAQVVIGAWNQARRKIVFDTDVPQIDYQFAIEESDKFPQSSTVAVVGSGLKTFELMSQFHRKNLSAEFWMLSERCPLKIESQSLNSRENIGGTAHDHELKLTSGSPKKILQQVHSHLKLAPQKNWQLIVQDLKRQVPQIWKAWSLRQKSQFIRHLQPLWELMKTVIPEAVKFQIQELQDHGLLEIQYGHIETIFHQEILWKPLGQERLREKKFDVLIQFPKIETNIVFNSSPVLKGLIQEGMVVPDALRLGVQTDMKGRPITAQGDVLKNFYIVGPLLKPLYYESSVGADINRQIYQLLQSLTESTQIQVDSTL